MRVLVADSHSDYRDSFVAHLERRGHRTLALDTGMEVLEHLQEAQVLVLDVDLPDTDGVHLCELVRQASAVPIVTMTSAATELEHIMCLTAGADDSVSKPVTVRELEARVNAVTRRYVVRGEPGPVWPSVTRPAGHT
jgi:DNA-binding response OmpR family regulator